MSKSLIDQACEILQQTRDGDDLDPRDLKLIEIAVNGFLNEAGEVAFQDLYSRVQNGYVKPWFHGIEHLTRDHEGYVYWKGKHIEHYSFGDYEREKVAARELAQRCILLERNNLPVNTTSAIWRWETAADELSPRIQ